VADAEDTPFHQGRALSLVVFLPPVAMCLALGAGAWLAGADPGHSVALGLGAGATSFAVTSLRRLPDPRWPDPPEVDGGRGWHGAALQSRLLERLDVEPERIPRLLLPRLRALVSSALVTRGAVPASAQARELVGAELYDLLSAATWADGRPNATELTDRVVSRVAELSAPGADPAPPAPGHAS